MTLDEITAQHAAPAALIRIRVTFGKVDAMRYVGNLDMHTVWERTLRRAGLPIAYSKGFSPHPRFQIGASLPMGASSRCELLDAWLEWPLPTEEMRARLQRAAPPGLEVIALQEVALAEPALQHSLLASEYVLTLREPVPMEELAQRIKAVLGTPSLPREWRRKPYDLRPLIEQLQLQPPAQIYMRLSAREGATGRPEEVLSALALDPLSAAVERTRLLFASP